MIKDMKVGYTLWVAEDVDDDWDMKYLDTTGDRVITEWSELVSFRMAAKMVLHTLGQLTILTASKLETF